MRVLVTGGCGFIGTNLVAQLNKHGASHVRVFDNETLGKREFLAGEDAEFVHGDLQDADAVRSAVEGMDVIVHLAADTRVIPSIEKPKFNFDVNVAGTINVLEAMREAGVERLINASTGGAIIGEADPPVHEGMVPSPLSPYGASKLAVEGYCSAYGASYGLKTVSLRFSNVYGPRSFHKGSVVALFLKHILNGEELTVYGDGGQTRDYVFAADLCDGIIAATKISHSDIIQLGTGIPTSLNSLIDTMRDVVDGANIRVRYEDARPGEVTHTYCDISKARRVIGYDPQTKVADGIASTWNWFLENQARFAA